MTLWFTADTHFNHTNAIEYCFRPFETLAEMTDTIVARWNEAVKPGDTIFHLGDFALSWGKIHAATLDAILARLRGQKWLIAGNHDRDEVKKNPRWHAVRDYHELKVDLGDIHKQRIVLFHYSIRSWNQMHRGAWMLHGHSHGNLVDIGGKTMDVGVDVHDYRPISLEEVQQFMAGREIVTYDHHTPEDEKEKLECSKKLT